MANRLTRRNRNRKNRKTTRRNRKNRRQTGAGGMGLAKCQCGWDSVNKRCNPCGGGRRRQGGGGGMGLSGCGGRGLCYNSEGLFSHCADANGNC